MTNFSKIFLKNSTAHSGFFSHNTCIDNRKNLFSIFSKSSKLVLASSYLPRKTSSIHMHDVIFWLSRITLFNSFCIFALYCQNIHKIVMNIILRRFDLQRLSVLDFSLHQLITTLKYHSEIIIDGGLHWISQRNFLILLFCLFMSSFLAKAEISLKMSSIAVEFCWKGYFAGEDWYITLTKVKVSLTLFNFILQSWDLYSLRVVKVTFAPLVVFT